MKSIIAEQRSDNLPLHNFVEEEVLSDEEEMVATGPAFYDDCLRQPSIARDMLD